MSNRTCGRSYVRLAVTALAMLAGAVALASCKPPPSGGTFRDEIVFSGLQQPTAVRFAQDGRVFVAEKSGVIKVFDNLDDETPTVFANLRTEVANFWDRGLLDIELDPNFPTTPYVYALYTRDAAIGGTTPTWGTVGGVSDPCPTPPGPTIDGCVVSGRLVRLQAAGNQMTGTPTVLVDDWCMPSPTHTIGSLTFGPDGALYASGGDGAFFFTWIDYGQTGYPAKNPCGDPPVPVGGTQSIPTAQGGALRSQDLRTAGDPVTLDGTIIRIDKTTGAGLPTNPLAASSDPNARRVIAYGLRNPFRIAFRTGTSELWVGDVGWGKVEEINRLGNVADTVVDNFGWPCYEGAARQASWSTANLNLCDNLYAQGANAVVRPVYAYRHDEEVYPTDGCGLGGSVTGLAFASKTSLAYPAEYQGAVFWGDYSRECIWTAPLGTDGKPNFALRKVFVKDAATPVQLRIGPGGNLYYVDLDGGTIRRVVYQPPPKAVIIADKTAGPIPLPVQFDGRTSSDPNGLPLTYQWDLDGDGAYDDSTSATPVWTYTVSNDVTVRLRVTNTTGAKGTTALKITAGDTPPVAVIDTPMADLTWTVGDAIGFSGHATDTEQGPLPLPAAALSWDLILQHCAATCHQHPIETFEGIANGSFIAPDHDYPSHLELRLTATDNRGLTSITSIELEPQTTTLDLVSDPPGLFVTAGTDSLPAPFVQTVITGTRLTVSAPSPQTVGPTTYTFTGWSDGGAASHDVVIGTATTLTATFAATPG